MAKQDKQTKAEFKKDVKFTENFINQLFYYAYKAGIQQGKKIAIDEFTKFFEISILPLIVDIKETDIVMIMYEKCLKKIKRAEK